MSKRIINEGGIIGLDSPHKVITKDEYNIIKSHVDKYISEQSVEQRLKVKLDSLKYRMEDYLSNDKPELIIEAGDFLREILKE